MPRVPGSYFESRRQEILEAAARVFSRRGIQGATMAEIAGEAGLTPGALYRYFASKEALADHCFGVNTLELQKRWAAPGEPGQSPIAGFIELARETVQRLHQPAERAATMLYLEHLLDALRDDDSAALSILREERQQTQRHVEARIAAAAEAGELPAGADPAQLAAALTTFYFGARLAALLEPANDGTREWAEFERLLLAAMPPQAPGATIA